MLNSNAIAWSQFQLRRGWKNTAWFVGIYSALVIAAYTATSALGQGNGAPQIWVSLLLTIQSAMLVLYGASVIATAIRNDVTTRMIESHRLMPLPAGHAIYGYFLGAAGQIIMLAACNFVIGLAICVTNGMSAESWIIANITLALFAVFLWTIGAFMAFTATRGKGGAGWIVVIVIISISSQGWVFGFIPALTVLCTPIIGRSIFGSMAALSQITDTYAISFLGQFALGGLFYAACMRRYREEGVRGFTPVMALLLLAVWAGLSVYAIRNWGRIQPAMLRRAMGSEEDISLMQTVASTALTMLIACLPLGASAAFHRSWLIRRALGGAGVPKRPLHPALAAILASAICLAIVAVAPLVANELRANYFGENVALSDRTIALAITSAMLLAFMFSALHLLRLFSRMRPLAMRGLILLFLLLTWAGPVMYESIRNAMENTHRLKWSWIGGISPIITLIICWGDTHDINTNPLPGVIVQIMIAIALAMLFHLTRRKIAAPVPVADASQAS